MHAERQKLDKISYKRDIIEEYGNFASKVYAPKARDGAFPDTTAKNLAKEIVSTTNYQDLIELETKLPKQIVEHVISRKNNDEFEKSPERRRVTNVVYLGKTITRSTWRNEYKNERT